MKNTDIVHIFCADAHISLSQLGYKMIGDKSGLSTWLNWERLSIKSIKYVNEYVCRGDWHVEQETKRRPALNVDGIVQQAGVRWAKGRKMSKLLWNKLNSFWVDASVASAIIQGL